jgi:hypothetical protein
MKRRSFLVHFNERFKEQESTYAFTSSEGVHLDQPLSIPGHFPLTLLSFCVKSAEILKRRHGLQYTPSFADAAQGRRIIRLGAFSSQGEMKESKYKVVSWTAIGVGAHEGKPSDLVGAIFGGLLRLVSKHTSRDYMLTKGTFSL